MRFFLGACVDLPAQTRQKRAVEGVTDESLLRAWQGGDAEAGAQLFDRHYEGLSRFFRNKVDDSRRDDIIQQTFMAVPTAAFDGRSSVRTWLFAIAWRPAPASVWVPISGSSGSANPPTRRSRPMRCAARDRAVDGPDSGASPQPPRPFHRRPADRPSAERSGGGPRWIVGGGGGTLFPPE